MPSKELVCPPMKFQYVRIEESQHLLKLCVVFECGRESIKARHRLSNHGVGFNQLLES